MLGNGEGDGVARFECGHESMGQNKTTTCTHPCPSKVPGNKRSNQKGVAKRAGKAVRESGYSASCACFAKMRHAFLWKVLVLIY